MSVAAPIRELEAPLRGTAETVVGAPAALEILKHKPGRRRTLRAAGPRGTAIVKVYASTRAQEVAARLRALAGGPPEPRLPAVLLTAPARHMIVLSEVPGVPLRDRLLRAERTACARAGAALAAWHAFWRAAGPPPPLRPHTAACELETLRERAGVTPGPLAAAAESLASSLAGEWPCSTVVHRDLYEDQVLVGERVGMIDLDDAAIGPPELDLGNLLAHVELLARRRSESVRPEMDALLAAYRARGPQLDDGLLERCRALSLIRLACIHREPRLLEGVGV
jgi:Ser/Thr protein kinase RdoA (MazF antagonist)